MAPESSSGVHPRVRRSVPLVVGVALGLLTELACGGGGSVGDDRMSVLTGDEQATGLACEATSFNIAFWPDGHSEIPSLNAPDAPTPHVDDQMDT